MSDMCIYEITARKVDDPNHLVCINALPTNETTARHIVNLCREQCPDLTGYVIWEKRMTASGPRPVIETCIYREAI